MTHRTIICVLLIVVMGVALACSQNKQPTESSPPPPSALPPAMSFPSQSPYVGLATMEVKIISRGLIVKARLDSVESDIITAADDKYRTVVKFNLTVIEHLKGTSRQAL